MDNKDRLVLTKILKHAKDIVMETNEFDNSLDFKNDNNSKAALFDLVQIGELAKNGLSAEAIKELSAIPWNPIYGLRNRIVHGYAQVDYQIIFETIKDDIPKLIDEITKNIAEIEELKVDEHASENGEGNN